MQQGHGDDELLVIPRCALQSARSLRLLCLYKLEEITQPPPIHADLISDAELMSALAHDENRSTDPVNTLLYGDSIAARMAKDLPANFEVVGKGGFDAPKLTRFADKLPNRQYENVMLVEGINDSRRTTFDSHKFMCTYNTLVDQLVAKYPGTEPANFFLATIPPSKYRASDDELVRAVANTIICCAAKRVGGTVINMDALFGPASAENIRAKLKDSVHFADDFQRTVAAHLVALSTGCAPIPVPFAVNRGPSHPFRSELTQPKSANAHQLCKQEPQQATSQQNANPIQRVPATRPQQQGRQQPPVTSSPNIRNSALSKLAAHRDSSAWNIVNRKQRNSRPQSSVSSTHLSISPDGAVRGRAPFTLGDWTSATSRGSRRHAPIRTNTGRPAITPLLNVRARPALDSWSGSLAEFCRHFPLLAGSI